LYRRVFGAACVFAGLLLSSPSAALAQAREPSAVVEAAKGRAAYERGDFREAVALYEKAYALEDSPTLLFNMGRCYEALATERDLRLAVEKYEAYLAATKNAPDREAVKRRIEALREQVRVLENARLAAVAPPPAAPAPGPAPAPAPPTEDGPAASPWPWVLAGSGGAVLTTGAIFGALALSTHDEAVASPSGEEAMDLEATASTFSTAATVMLVAGAAMAVGGVVWGSVDVVRANGRHAHRVRLRASASNVALRVDF
jgi:tetratricopeptide (TPR) repeat protein